MSPSKKDPNGRRCGVFWDYGSLFQHERTEPETELFKQGLGFLGSFYSLRKSYVFRLTSFPEGYPEGYDLPSGANVAAYPDRGCTSPSPCPAHETPSLRNAPYAPPIYAPHPLCHPPRSRWLHAPPARLQVVLHRVELGDHVQEHHQVARPRQAPRRRAYLVRCRPLMCLRSQ